MTDIITRAEYALELWDKTTGVTIEITYGMAAAEDAYRKAPEIVRELVDALKAAQVETDQAVADWGENDEQMLAENNRLAEELKAALAENERLRGKAKHPIGRCGDPNCGGDW